jgi:predicted transcriptional regulator
MVSDLTDRLFAGRVTDLVSHLISEHEIDADELAELNGLIADAEKKERS